MLVDEIGKYFRDNAPFSKSVYLESYFEWTLSPIFHLKVMGDL